MRERHTPCEADRAQIAAVKPSAIFLEGGSFFFPPPVLPTRKKPQIFLPEDKVPSATKASHFKNRSSFAEELLLTSPILALTFRALAADNSQKPEFAGFTRLIFSASAAQEDLLWLRR